MLAKTNSMKSQQIKRRLKRTRRSNDSSTFYCSTADSRQFLVDTLELTASIIRRFHKIHDDRAKGYLNNDLL